METILVLTEYTYTVAEKDVAKVTEYVPEMISFALEEYPFDDPMLATPEDLGGIIGDTGSTKDVYLGEYDENGKDPFDKYIGGDSMISLHLLQNLRPCDVIVNTELTRMDYAENVCRVFLILRPFCGWARVRHVLRVRAIVIYWLFLTENLMGPGGESHKRDFDAFERDELCT